MGGEIRVDPPSLRQLADQLDSVVSMLGTAQQSVLSSEIQADAFSPSGQPLAYAFLAAIEYAGNDAFEQGDQIGSIQRRLRSTAAIYEATEIASTVVEI